MPVHARRRRRRRWGLRLAKESCGAADTLFLAGSNSVLQARYVDCLAGTQNHHPDSHNYTATMCNSHLGSPAPNQKNKSPITVDGINNSMPGDPTAWGLERGARARATFCTEGRHRSCCGTPIVRQRLELSPVVWGHGSVCALRARTHRSIAATCRTLTLTVFVNADLRCVPDTGHARLRRSRRSVNVV